MSYTHWSLYSEFYFTQVRIVNDAQESDDFRCLFKNMVTDVCSEQLQHAQGVVLSKQLQDQERADSMKDLTDTL